MIGSNSIETPETESTDDKVKQVPQNGPTTVVAFHNELDLVKLNKYISGKKWTVAYYNQLTAENDNVKPFDTEGTAAVYQYEKIEKFELIVETEIDISNYDSLSGSSIISSGVIPHQGDLFIATLDMNRIALFSITEVTREHYNLNPVYKVSYSLNNFLESNAELFNDLENKVVRTFVFDKDSNFTNSSPILTKTDYIMKVNLSDTIKTLTSFYFSTFYDKAHNILTVPNTVGKVIIDPYLETFIFKIIDYTNNLFINRINRFPTESEDILFNTIYDVLLNRNSNLLKHIDLDYFAVTRSHYDQIPVLKTGRYFNVDLVVSNRRNKSETSSSGDNMLSLVEKPNIPNSLLPNRLTTETLLFSKEFLTKEPKTVIEETTLEYIFNNTINEENLVKLIDDYMNWIDIDKFYYIPILILLLKSRITHLKSHGTSYGY